MATPSKKSAAYEKGLREGRADKSKPAIEIEIKPEGEEEEEGTEGEEMDAAKSHSRKRSAKGSKNTKPAADGMYGKKPMDAECGCMGKGRKGKCDGSCSKKMDRNDALTPQEYLAACELGIQNRSRSYIRARLDTAERLDLKCGKGSISEGEKCHVGAAQKVQPKQTSSKRRGSVGGSKVRGLKTAAKIAGAAALIGGAAYMQQTARRNMLQRGAMAAPGTRSNTAFLNEVRKLGGNNETARKMRERAFANKIAEAYTKKRRDSVYAAGFTPDLGQLAI